jgi:hypothetical protein
MEQAGKLVVSVVAAALFSPVQPEVVKQETVIGV